MTRLMTICACAILSISLMFVAGCGGSTPKRTADDCVDCLKDADFDRMRQMATGEMIQWIDRAERKYTEVAELLGEKMAKKLTDTYDDLKCESGDVTEDGDKATVQIKINGQNTPMTLIKMGDKWRIEKFEFPII